MTFAWDKNKSQANLAKLGVTFDAAKEIFGGPLLEIIDDRRDYGEPRIGAIGVAHGVELTVIYIRRGATRRIISARRPRRDERRAYYQTYPG